MMTLAPPTPSPSPPVHHHMVATAPTLPPQPQLVLAVQQPQPVLAVQPTVVVAGPRCTWRVRWGTRLERAQALPCAAQT
jgi:hypothetical protein